MITTIIICVTVLLCFIIMSSTVKDFANIKYKTENTESQPKRKVGFEPTISQEELDKLQEKEKTIDIGKVMEFLDGYNGGESIE